MLQTDPVGAFELISTDTIVIWFGIGVVVITGVVFLLRKIAPSAVKEADSDWWTWTDSDDSTDTSGESGGDSD